jgi:integrase
MWVEPHNGKFRIRDRRGGRCVTIESGIDTKTAAKYVMAKHRGDQIRGDFIDPRAGRITIADFVAGWWGKDGERGHVNTLKESARRQETGRINNHILPRIGHIRLDEYDNATDAWWVSEMGADGLGPKSVRNVHGLMFQAMEAAAAARKIRINPCKGTKMPELIAHEMRFLLEPEAERLITALPEHWRAIPIVLLGTGMRWAELAGLRAGRVDIIGGSLRVEETLQEITGRGLVSVPPKTRWSRRTITLPEQAVDALVPLAAARRRNEYLFLEPSGEPLRHKHFYKYVWMPARERADLDGVRIHDLRHTHAAWLISDEVPLTAVQRRLGHSSIAITSDIYGHLLPHVDEKLLGSLQRRMSILPGEQTGSSHAGTDRSLPVFAGDNRR